MLFGKRNTADSGADLSGVLIGSRAGYFAGLTSPAMLGPGIVKKAGFITVTPPDTDVISWVSSIKARLKGAVTIVDISNDILRNFSLSYDFADLLVINPDGKDGIDSMDISDTVNLLDTILNLRLCYEKLTPIYLRVSEKVTPDELNTLLTFCRLSGVDGIVSPGPVKTATIRELTDGRYPLLGYASSPEEAVQTIAAGASAVELHASRWQFGKLLKTLER